MPWTWDSSVETAVRSGRFSVRTLLDVWLDDDHYHFWDDLTQQTFKDWNDDDQTYIPVADLLSISAYKTGQDLGPKGLKIRLNASALDDPAEILTELENSDYHLRPVAIREVLLSLDDHQASVVGYIPRFYGLMDHMERTEGLGDDQLYLDVSCESGVRWFTRRNLRTRSDQDQQELYPGDTFFANTGIAGRGQINWGGKSHDVPGSGASSRGSRPMNIVRRSLTK